MQSIQKKYSAKPPYVCYHELGDKNDNKGISESEEDLQVAEYLLDTLTAHKDGCDCDEILSLIEQGKIDTTPLITHRFALKDIEKAYEIFENKLDGVIKIAVEN